MDKLGDSYIWVTTNNDTKEIIEKWIKEFINEIDKNNKVYQTDTKGNNPWHFQHFPENKKTWDYLSNKILELLTLKSLSKYGYYGKVMYYDKNFDFYPLTHGKRFLEFNKGCTDIRNPKWKYEIKIKYHISSKFGLTTYKNSIIIDQDNSDSD